MLSIEPIEISKSELKRLVLAAVLLPPVCTLAGALIAASWIHSEPSALAAGAGDAGGIVRMAESIPTIELAPAAFEPGPSFSLLPAPAISFDAAVSDASTPSIAPEALVQPAVVDSSTTFEAAPVAASEPVATEAVEIPAVTPEPVSVVHTASLPKTASSGHFVVQAGVFTREANARLYRERLLRRGVSSAVIENAGARRTVWHVVLGRYETWRAAERARKLLSSDLKIELISTRLPLHSVTQQVATI